MKLEIGSRMMNVSFEPITMFSRGQAPRLISALGKDDLIIIVKHGKPIAALSRVVETNDGGFEVQLVEGLVPIENN